MTSAQFLVIMAKEPRPGRVKTRLSKDIGTINALWWYRHQLRRLFRRLRDPRWQILIAASPDRCVTNSAQWPPNLPIIPQGRGDLGHRMARAIRSKLPARVVLIGSDVPTIERKHIATAFSALGRTKQVIGPATDGGYWLIGRRGLPIVPVRWLDGVRWSTEFALADTLDRIGPDTLLLHRLRDVDRAEDL